MLDFFSETLRHFLQEYKAGGISNVWGYLVVTLFLLVVLVFIISLVKHLVLQLILSQSEQKTTIGTVIERKIIRRSFFIKFFLFKDTQDKYIVVLRTKKYGDLEYEDVEFYAHSQIGKKHEVTVSSIQFLNKIRENHITNVKYTVN